MAEVTFFAAMSGVEVPVTTVTISPGGLTTASRQGSLAISGPGVSVVTVYWNGDSLVPALVGPTQGIIDGTGGIELTETLDLGPGRFASTTSGALDPSDTADSDPYGFAQYSSPATQTSAAALSSPSTVAAATETGLSAGGTAGIAVGCFVLAAFLAGFLTRSLMRQRSRRSTKSDRVFLQTVGQGDGKESGRMRQSRHELEEASRLAELGNASIGPELEGSRPAVELA